MLDYLDGGLKEFTFTTNTINAETISKGISNSISTSKSVSMTESSEDTVSWNMSSGTSSSNTKSFNAEVAVSLYFADVGVSRGTSDTDTTSTAVEQGKTSTTTTAQTIASSVAKEANKNYQINNSLQQQIESKWNFDMQNYERGYWYVLGLVADIEVHQIVGYDLTNNELYTTYFVSALRGEGLRMLSSDSAVFDVKPEYQLAPITEIEVNGGEVAPPKPPICEYCNGIGDAEHFGGGCGAESHPYLIATKTHFENISNVDSHDKYFKLTNSIDLGIWNEPFAFSGNLNGNKKDITYTQSLNGNILFYGGLFTRLSNESSVQDLRINAYIKKDDGGTKEGYVGALAGISSGEVNVSRVSVDGKISIGNYSGFNYVGGVFGKFVGGRISECANATEIKNYGKNVFSGGIIGYAIATDKSIKISNCYNTGNILASSNYTAAYGWRSGGGITGQVKGHDKNKLGIEYCYNDSVVKLEWTGVATGGWQGCGGILGDVRNGNHNNITVDYSYWNKTKNNYYGNNGVYHKNNGRKDMTGTYDRWSADIWIFSNSSAPALKWMQE